MYIYSVCTATVLHARSPSASAPYNAYMHDIFIYLPTTSIYITRYRTYSIHRYMVCSPSTSAIWLNPMLLTLYTFKYV